MKKILIVDESALFRDFLTRKLTELGFDVTAAKSGLDANSKIRADNPDLIIMDYYLSRMPATEILMQKSRNPNTASIPVVLASGKLDREQLVQIAKLGVKKVFTKPIRIDALIAAISEILGVSLTMDTSPCILEAHFNDEILFVEVAQGLNREKIELLGYKITELMEIYEVSSAKVLILMSSIDVGPEDTINLGALLTSVLDTTHAKTSRVKVLTNSEFVREFVKDRKEYNGMEVTDSLDAAMDGLLGAKADEFRDQESKTVGEEFLKAAPPRNGAEETIEIKFQTERPGFDLSAMGQSVVVAVVDDDFVIRELVKAVLADTGFTIREYRNGKEFVDDADAESADLVFLDLMMPEMDGFQVMAEMKRRGSDVPIIVLSALSQRETVVKARQHGVSSYIVKPLDPEAVLNKAKEILKTNF